MSNAFSTPKQRVEYGLDSIPAERTVTVRLRDLMFVHQTLAQFMEFFHQPLHFPDMAAVEEFLGNVDSGDGFQVLHEALHRKISPMVPTDIEEAFAEGQRFEHPLPPIYFRTQDKGGKNQTEAE